MKLGASSCVAAMKRQEEAARRVPRVGGASASARTSETVKQAAGAAHWPWPLLRGGCKPLLGFGVRHQNREGGTAPGGALDPDAAAEILDDAPADGEAEARALRLPAQRVADLPELLEDELLVVAGDAGA